MAFVLNSAPKNSRFILVYGVQLPMMEEPAPEDERSWYRVHWTRDAIGDEGRKVRGYWDPDIEEMWLRDPQAWLPIPEAPVLSQLLNSPTDDPIAMLNTLARRGRASQTRR